MRKKFLSVIALSTLLFLGSCGGSSDGGSNISQKVDDVYKVSVSTSTSYEVTGLKEGYKVGEKVTFEVKVLDSTKQISFVRLNDENKTTLNPDAQGKYSFDMIAQDVVLTIRLKNKEVPTYDLQVYLEGSVGLGATVQVKAKLDGKEITDFQIKAITGESLISIDQNNKTITCNENGNVTIRVSTVVDENTVEKDYSFVIAESESSLGQNIAYYTNKITFGGESVSTGNRGDFTVWGGDGGSVSNYRYDSSKEQYTFSYATGWAWYSVQIFYTLPYAQVDDEYSVRWSVNSDVAGKMTINGILYDIIEGDNELAFNVKQKNKATISIQFGSDADSAATLSGSVFKFDKPRIYDNNKETKYHQVKFLVDDTVLKDIQVKEGKTVTAPNAPIKEGMIFKAWQENGVNFIDSQTIDKAHTYIAVYEEKNADTTKVVTLMDGDNKLIDIDVAKGGVLTLPNDLDVGFGHELVGVYIDKALTTPFDFTTSITENLTLYIKKQIAFETSYADDGGLGYHVPTDWITHGDNGEFIMTFNGWGGQSWHVQLNYEKTLPWGEAGKTYTINYEYSITAGGAQVLIWDGGTPAGPNALEGDGVKHSDSLSYPGATINADQKKLTFEFGATPIDTEIVFTLYSISITVA